MSKCDKYNGNCTICENTELPNIKDANEVKIGYSYAYKTDCAGERYIKAEEVKYLLECERNKAIDDCIDKFAEILSNIPDICAYSCPVKCNWGTEESCIDMCKKWLAEQLKGE